MNTNTHFVIGIRNKIPYKISGPDYIVTDNSDYTLELVPDEQWEGMETKTVIYAYDNGTAVHNPINGNQDKIPIIQASGNLHIGVTAGDIRTSTWVSVPIRGSIRRKAGTGIKPPAPDVYDKIMDMIGKQTGIKSVEIQEGSVTDEGGVGETPVYYLVITEKSGKIFKEKLPNFEVDPKQIVKLQKGAPTEETEGIQNQLLINKDDWTIYVCTGAVLVLGEYTYFWQQIVGSGGSGDVGTDITLGITGAVVGRTVKITEVDENGKPVKWESADIPAQTDIDSTLSIEGAAADAKAVGDKLTELSKAKADRTGWTPNKFLGTDAEGNLAEKDAPAGDGWTIDGLTTETEITDDDTLPYYDTSAKGQRKTLWGNIKAVLKTYFDSVYLKLSGGTLTGKIVLPTDNQNVGITNSGDIKILGYGNIGSVSHLRIGDSTRPIQLRGSTERPKYNDGELVLKSELDTALGSYITDIDALIGGDA